MKKKIVIGGLSFALTISLGLLALYLLPHFGGVRVTEVDEPVSTTSEASKDREYISPGNFKQALESRNLDRIIESLNHIKRMTYQGDILPFMLDLWHDTRDKHPEVPWSIVEKDAIRIEITNVLVQAQRNGRVSVDREALHRYAREMIQSSDIAVAESAL